METITLTLPSETYRLLQERARKAGKHLPQLLLEVIEEALKKTSGSLPVPTRSVAQIFEASGRLRSLSPYLQDKIITGVTLEEVKASLQRAGGKSLSDIIMEQRGTKP